MIPTHAKFGGPLQRIEMGRALWSRWGHLHPGGRELGVGMDYYMGSQVSELRGQSQVSLSFQLIHPLCMWTQALLPTISMGIICFMSDSG